MAEITAAAVKALRDLTDLPMMDCKKALVETNGDIEAAVEHMRKTGLAKADKKSGRTAAEGAVVCKTAGDGKADPATCTGDDNGFSIKRYGHGILG